MKIAVLSDCRIPTRAVGGHGLGRLAMDLARGLHDAGHTVTLYAGTGSDAPVSSNEFDTVRLCFDADESQRARNLAADHVYLDQDAILDLSHQHDLSKYLHADRLVINWVADLECQYQPPNAVVGNAWQQQRFPSAKIVPLGIDVENIPFFGQAERDLADIRGTFQPYLAYAAKIEARKGFDLAGEVHQRQSIPVRFVGHKFFEVALPWWVESLEGADFWRFLGDAVALLSPCRQDAGGRVNLEAAACGTPVLCLEGTGTACHVEHGVSGFICRDLDELVDAVQDVPLLERRAAREWVRETHDLSVMVREIERLCEAVADGEGW